jgi:tRNA-specific 2-thiouridylase
MADMDMLKSADSVDPGKAKVAVGLSGGVDSAVAALLLKEAGYDVRAVTMTLGRKDEAVSLAHTAEAARSLGLELEVFDFSAEWERAVADYIRETYLSGLTPNPCVRCNEVVKFSLLPRSAFAAGADFFATGHYARIVHSPEGGVRLLRGVDRAKDQSYFLYRVPDEILSRTLFPLGGMTKTEVRAKAAAHGFAAADRGDSQDFCGGDPMDFVGEDERCGDIVDTSGRKLGRHKGFWRYTVGMRKGLGIGGGIPYYVTAINARRNEVVVAFKESAIIREFSLTDAVAIGGRALHGSFSVKVRSAGEPRGPVWVEDGKVSCPEGLMGVAPGQSAVFFDGDEIVGGGVIAPPAVP